MNGEAPNNGVPEYRITKKNNETISRRVQIKYIPITWHFSIL